MAFPPLQLTPLAAARLIVLDYAGALPNVLERIDLNGVQSAIFLVGEEKVLLIRGTNQMSDWLRYNFNFLPENAPGDHYKWHGGFLRHAQIAYAFAKNKGVTLVIGHSLGAAAACIVATSLAIPAITFATPRPLFGPELPPSSSLIVNYCRVDDLVAMVPPSFLGFGHCGQVHWLETHGNHVGEDHRIQHYIELLELLEAMEQSASSDSTANQDQANA